LGYFYTSTSCCAVLLSSAYFTRSDRCVLFPLGCVQLQLNVVQMYSHGILVVFVVLLAKCLKWLTNAKTPYAFVQKIAAQTAFDYKLVTWGSSCIWSLCHVPLSFFEKQKSSTSSGSTIAIVSHVKLEPPTSLYCTDIRIIISF